MSAYAGEQFLNAEGLGDVIVGTGIEGFDLGALVFANGEDNDRRIALGANGSADVYTAEAGHHEVCDDEVGSPVFEDTEPLLRVVGDADVITLRGERSTEHASNLRLIVDNENSA